MSEITKIIQFNSMMDETEKIKKYMRENNILRSDADFFFLLFKNNSVS